MEPLLSRILLQHVKGETIAYLYNRDSFNLLKIDCHPYDNSQFIEIGSTLEYNGTKYKVESINYKMEKELYEMGNDYGVNLYAPTDASDFNCQVGVFVNDI